MRNNGFTLIELLAVLVIVGAVMALAIPAILGSGDNARNKISEIEERNLKEAGKMLAIDIDNPVSEIYKCTGWIWNLCTKENSKWKSVNVTIGDLIDHGYFNDNGGHLDRNITLTINNDYTVSING